ncbi:MAG: rhodopsin [Actinobacteria bacterium]|jgi:sensory rhodopsin|nr:rhodopsin [Actinomycetota bacterium]
MLSLTQGDSMLAVATTALFVLGFVGMAAGTVYFVMEKPELKPQHRSVAIYAAIITFVAAIMYYNMMNLALAGDIGSTMPLRYIDWIITTPLLLLEVGIVAAIAGAVKKGLIARLMIADVIMIATGYLGEVSNTGEPMTYVWFIISSLAYFWIVAEVFGIKVTGSGYAAKAVTSLKWFVIIGWAIYPIGTATEEFMRLGAADEKTLVTAGLIAACIYIVADLTNKVIFGIVAVRAAKNS